MVPTVLLCLTWRQGWILHCPDAPGPRCCLLDFGVIWQNYPQPSLCHPSRLGWGKKRDSDLFITLLLGAKIISPSCHPVIVFHYLRHWGVLSILFFCISKARTRACVLNKEQLSSREFVVFQVTPSLGSILCWRTIDISHSLLIPPLSQEEEIASTALLGSFRAYVKSFP